MPESLSFADLGVPDDLRRWLDRCGFAAPFPIQAAVVPDGLAGRDVVGRAPTGSGKTLAFGLPVVAGLAPARPCRPVALVLVPTRELADQIATELAPLARVRGHRVAALYGGTGYEAQRRRLRAGAELVVACPGRLEDLLAQGDVALDDVAVLVVDEADRMADMGFLPSVRRLAAKAGGRHQTLLFSATSDRAMEQLSAELQVDPARSEVGPARVGAGRAEHLFWQVPRAARTRHAAEVVVAVGPTVVFCRTRRGADRVAKQLVAQGVTAAAIHGGRTQGQRERALRAFAAGQVQSLVATDVAARGIHVAGVAGVVHFDPPEDAAAYLHRSGRTARAGATGVVVSFVEAGESSASLRLQADAGLEPGFAPVDVPALAAARPTSPIRVTAPAPEAEPAVVREPRREPGGTGRRDRPTSPLARAGRPAPPGPGRTPRRRRQAERARSGLERGTVKLFDRRRGYGFITTGPGAADLFVHHTQLVGVAGGALSPGQRVRFEVGQGPKGPQARNVRVG